ncbi:FAD-binding oxidoreductase [cf. Phormidesmis sp. LEGE 11477]|uniref:FAD-binding oxidoreductase n=1 Tax=cf. Phormidesmis sp. LEGE 11477 TaxID=1828680 RepID=UPI00187E692F|nr:FAD-binding protein [cf. Phormidesmis sp. LEGE 11477]MBE9060625.1 FAD-binding protein [cf. Phormidesmis sp. LEGE 11477]
MNSLVSDLQPLIAGDVTDAAEALEAVSGDFGGAVHKRPRVVVRPNSAADIAAVVKYAIAQGLHVSTRAAGHSLNGQALSQDGILLDMRSLNQLHELNQDELWFRADAGTTWQQVVDAALPKGVIPPVLTNNLDVTLGGTHAAAGLGQSSFRYGSQADNCLALEVVTSTGDILWCSPEQNRELFDHVLCGYGQFGIITQVQHRLRRYRPHTRTYFLCYDDLSVLLKDQQKIVQSELVDSLLTVFSPCVLGFSRTENGPRPIVQWFYRIQATLELEQVSDLDETAFLSSLNFYRHVHTEDAAFEAYVQPLMQVPRPVETANPWLDVMLPASAAQEFIETALAQVPSFIDFRATPIGSFSLLSRHLHRPMFAVPQEELILGFGMYPTVPKARLEPVLKQLEQLSDLGFKLGGKRYLVSWIDFNRKQWKQQFGDYWSTLNDMKRRYDPQGIFNPGFIEYEENTCSPMLPSKAATPEAAAPTVPINGSPDDSIQDSSVPKEQIAAMGEPTPKASGLPAKALTVTAFALLVAWLLSEFSYSLV